jgi:carbon-monoxide dehydrogenase iron sulfur subunit
MTETAPVTQIHRIRTAPEQCRDCRACMLACSLHHEGDCHPSLSRVVVSKDMARYEFRIAICQQCDLPECIAVCPTGAMQRDSCGRVLLVEGECIQCGACASSCPFDAVFFNEVQGRYLKCDLCAGREEGPLCVKICPVGALTLSGEGTRVGG